MAFKKNQPVFWKDPDNHQSSGIYRVEESWNLGEDDETCLIMSDHSEAVVLSRELENLFDLKRIKPGLCANCDGNGKKVAADLIEQNKYFCKICRGESANEKNGREILVCRITGNSFIKV